MTGVIYSLGVLFAFALVVAGIVEGGKAVVRVGLRWLASEIEAEHTELVNDAKPCSRGLRAVK